MGLFSKLKFGRKDNFDDLGKDTFGAEGFNDTPQDNFQDSFGAPGMQQNPPGFSSGAGTRPASMTPLTMEPQQHSFEGDKVSIIAKDIEVISSKLDVLKATLDSLNSRMANLERNMQGEHPTQKKMMW
jgi:hypothetical protein